MWGEGLLELVSLSFDGSLFKEGFPNASVTVAMLGLCIKLTDPSYWICIFVGL
jgi:hypothetical protein